ncbi:hypothetical protein K461DRAFT_241127 [Myriangium duriaei CBS 260.36]|uniref:Aminoglycoside phosphotransferase domain-containing protein n=1 Tax=Myriangium duriaei CBS 260.36 TaxID=1168546 RepID=A0A9P4J143_9PEZI|nr:hypothetical protein K461DRAFT_241127 [Myriangium duriaei CBS 260.36]
MKYLKQHTTIPVPCIHAWGLSGDNPLDLGPFIVIDNIHGVSLKDLWVRSNVGRMRSDILDEDLRTIYRQMSSIILELSNLPFAAIGSLALPDASNDVALVPTMASKSHQIESLSGVCTWRNHQKVLSSTADYYRTLLAQDKEQLLSQPNSASSWTQATNHYLALHQMHAAASEFTNPNEDVHGFRLVCDNMGLESIFVRSREDLTIVAMPDWGWSYAAPWQVFCSPPRWLAGEEPKYFDDEGMARYERLLAVFLKELSREEERRYGNGKVGVEGECSLLLSTSMHTSYTTSHFWLIESLLTPIAYSTTPWQRLITRYPYLETLRPPDPAEVSAYADKKMEQLRVYEAEMTGRERVIKGETRLRDWVREFRWKGMPIGEEAEEGHRLRVGAWRAAHR